MNTSNGNISKKKRTDTARPIYSITPFTLLDYPDHTACILWFAGCNMRCGYCYNPEIVDGKGKISYGDVLHFLEKRKNLLDAVVFSGGECTLHQNVLWLAHQIKELGMKVKIDTNGSRPHVLENLIAEKLVDYVALDFKALPGAYQKITASQLYGEFVESLDILVSNNIPFEVRTTLHSRLISQSDLVEMAKFLQEKGYQGKYYLQHYVGDTGSISFLPESCKSVFINSEFELPKNIIWRN
ncbi:anaerobic ribonucleoside-triphosphate reductase activating protein [Lunatimonas lonarensis]|nr:anaerobic ribonucleoside-triphosphate reductase activating protein [Lunatimonas lonarensis]